jgi:DNA-binding transcriptional ArsR family regulator
MSVVRLRSRRERVEKDWLVALRAAVAEPGGPEEVKRKLASILDREMASRSGWRFVMVEPNLNSRVVDWLTYHSQRPLVAVRLWGKLFQYLPPDSNEVTASREELARAVGCSPDDVSRVMGELEGLGAAYRRREGRSVRFYVHPSLGTHLTGTIRDKAQAEAPPLRLVEPA